MHGDEARHLGAGQQLCSGAAGRPHAAPRGLRCRQWRGVCAGRRAAPGAGLRGGVRAGARGDGALLEVHLLLPGGARELPEGRNRLPGARHRGLLHLGGGLGAKGDEGWHARRPLYRDLLS